MIGKVTPLRAVGLCISDMLGFECLLSAQVNTDRTILILRVIKNFHQFIKRPGGGGGGGGGGGVEIVK